MVNSLSETLKILKAVATAAHAKARDPYWKRCLEWVQRLEESTPSQWYVAQDLYKFASRVAGPLGFEPRTSGSEGRCHILTRQRALVRIVHNPLKNLIRKWILD